MCLSCGGGKAADTARPAAAGGIAVAVEHQQLVASAPAGRPVQPHQPEGPGVLPVRAAQFLPAHASLLDALVLAKTLPVIGFCWLVLVVTGVHILRRWITRRRARLRRPHPGQHCSASPANSPPTPIDPIPCPSTSTTVACLTPPGTAGITSSREFAPRTAPGRLLDVNVLSCGWAGWTMLPWICTIGGRLRNADVPPPGTRARGVWS